MSAVYTIAGHLDDPLSEEIVATLFSDQPVRPVVRPTDNRRHWQWWARGPSGQTSRIWIGYGEPITDDSVAELKDRAESSLAIFIPDFATSIDVAAIQTAITEVALVISVERLLQVDLTIQLLVQGGPGA